MKTYFIRHKSKDPKTFQTLLSENSIAIFFDNLPWHEVFDENAKTPRADYFTTDYSLKEGRGYSRAYTSAIRLINEIRSNGAYVFAEYGDAYLGNEQYGCILGRVEKDSSIVEIPGISKIGIRLIPSSIKKILYSDYPVLLAIRPPYGTICCPQRSTYAMVAEQLYGSKKITLSADLIHPNMVEQMCGEYLRIFSLHENDPSYRLAFCSMKIGKNLATIDISGRLQNGKRLFAQIKNGHINKSDEDKFIAFLGKDDIGIIFDKTRTTGTSRGVYRLNVDDIFQKFLKHNPQLIADLIGMPNLAPEILEPLKKSA